MTRQESPQSETAAEGSFDQVIAEEVRCVEREKGGRSAKLMILVLLCLIVAGYSSYYFKFSSSQQLESELVDNTPHYPVPERSQVPAGLGGSDASVEILSTVAAQAEPEEEVESQAIIAQQVPATVPKAKSPVVQQSPNSTLMSQEPIAQQAPDVQAVPETLSQPATIDFRVVSGPYISSAELAKVEALIKRQGWDYEKETGVGAVEMIRLLDGNYPTDAAHARLKELQQTYESAFVLPSAGGLDVYLASFHSSERAAVMLEELQRVGFKVRLVRSTVQLNRTQLLSEFMTVDNARQLLELLQREGINAEMTEKR